MPTLFHQRFEARAQRAIERSFGVTVTISKEGGSSGEFTATFDDQTNERYEHETGISLEYIARDWMLPASSIVIGGETIEPVCGMVITEGSDQYEILPIPGRNRKPAAELQPGGYRYLVHTKKIV